MKIIAPVIVVISLLFNLMSPRLVSASCIQQTPQEQLDNAEVIVQAVVTDITTKSRSTTVTAEVKKTIKGQAENTITFSTEYGSGLVTSVDFNFEEGAVYDIYLYRDQTGKLTTNSCTGTKLVTEAGLDGSNNMKFFGFYLWIIIGVVFIGGILIGLKLRKKKR